MSAAGRERRIRRLLAACDASEPGLAALEAAADLAGRTGAELTVLFVEDEDLLRLAGLPLARVVHVGTADVRPTDVATMEREIRALAAGARRALEDAARASGIRCSFRVVRGPVSASVLEAAPDADLVVLGRAGHAPRPGSPLGSTARFVAASAPNAVLLVGRGESLVSPVGVVYDGSEAAERALDLAAGLESEEALVVLATPDAFREGGEAKDAATARWAARGISARVRAVGSAAPSEVAAAARAEGVATLVVPLEAGPGGDGDLVERWSKVPCPVVFVR